MDTSNLTFTVLGCGNMGLAILNGLLTSQLNTAPQSENIDTGKPHFSHYIACVNRPESVPNVKSALSKVSGTNVDRGPVIDVWQGRNLEAVKKADVILLSCQSSHAIEMFSDPAMAKATSGKLLLNICVGLTTSRIEELLRNSSGGSNEASKCTIVHAMPNMASTVRESSTVIKSFDSELTSPFVSEIVQHIFSSIGTTITVPDSLMSAASITAAATPAFFALALEGVIKGAVAEGISRQDATIMAAQAMRGAAGLVLAGEAPKNVIEKVMTPGGCTEKGVEVLKAAKVGETFADAASTAVRKAFEMVQGK